MSSAIIFWDIETVPNLRGDAAANGMGAGMYDEVREAIEKFPKHIYLVQVTNVATDSRTRRGVLKGFGIGVGASALAYETLVPGELIWRQIKDKSIRTFNGHSDWVFSVAFSPDGRTSRDGTLKRHRQGASRLHGHTRTRPVGRVFLGWPRELY